jgi:hypothetical protein
MICFEGCIMDIIARREKGLIIPLNGIRNLDVMLNCSGEAVVTEVVSSDKITVVRDEYGDIFEKGTKDIKE